MKQNFNFIWMYTLEIVKYYFSINKPEEAFNIFNNGCILVKDYLPDAYSLAVKTLTKEQMDIIWDLDSKITSKSSS